MKWPLIIRSKTQPVLPMYSTYESRHKYHYIHVRSGVYVDREALVLDEEGVGGGEGSMKSDREIGHIGSPFLNNVRQLQLKFQYH